MAIEKQDQMNDKNKDFDKNGYHYTYIGDNTYVTYYPPTNTKLTLIFEEEDHPEVMENVRRLLFKEY